jgi:hypothetical protein
MTFLLLLPLMEDVLHQLAEHDMRGGLTFNQMWGFCL